MKHPNATAAAALSGPAAVAVWLAGEVGVSLSPEAAVFISSAVISVGLIIGRRGVRGLIRIIWRGGEA